ncbi:hypothetical protein [Kurthia huakuii]|uniref:hypothetical protein n=1 Tax=Kurthia huakuii TaxID=1421019 RepID=UPI0004965304|nr:hypothetical protein [Kurthia huakuii]MBM7699162.1 hypothetical protein [Kurthia huakuii]
MFKIEFIEEGISIRKVILKNLKTSTEEICYDHTMLLSFHHFRFMKIGETYRFNRYVWIGTQQFCEIANFKGDIYYIENFYMKNCNKFIHFQWARKDLIQVGEMIHPILS